MDFVKIPHERVGVLLGKNNENKELIEKKCNIKITLEGEGDIEITGEPMDVFFAKEVVKAIGRGFETNKALKLLANEYGLYIISLKEIARSENDMTRLKGRIIGEKGRIKIEIESATQSEVSVYGSTVSIISKIDTMEYAKEAIAMILDGAPHIAVLNYLAKTKRKIMEDRLKGSA